MAHITGGGLPENLPRCLGSGQSIRINPDTWTPLPIFNWISSVGQVPLKDMYNTFNMGVGMVVMVAPDDAVSAIEFFKSQGIESDRIGEVIAGAGDVVGLW